MGEIDRLADVVDRVANEQPIYRTGTIKDLRAAAKALRALSAEPPAKEAITGAQVWDIIRERTFSYQETDTPRQAFDRTMATIEAICLHELPSADPRQIERRVGRQTAWWIPCGSGEVSSVYDRRKPTEQYERQRATDDAAFLASLAPLPTERPALQTGVWDCEVTIGIQPMIDLSKPTERTAGTCIAFPNCSESECTIPAVCSGQAQCAKPRATERAAQQEGDIPLSCQWPACSCNERKNCNAGPAVAALPQEDGPLLGEWHHGDGVLCSGSLRIARADFDTNPADAFKREVFDWMCATLNAAQTFPPLAAAPQEAAPKDAAIPCHGIWNDQQESRHWSCHACHATCPGDCPDKSAPQAPREAQAVALGDALHALSAIPRDPSKIENLHLGRIEEARQYIKDALSASPAPEGWVSVSERLPEPFVPVLVRCESYDASYQNGCDIALLIAPADAWVIGKQQEPAHNVTHWMPLPATPEPREPRK